MEGCGLRIVEQQTPYLNSGIRGGGEDTQDPASLGQSSPTGDRHHFWAEWLHVLPSDFGFRLHIRLCK